ncbi:Protein transport protein SEC61 subunit alpha [Wickerhamiella sorbophila]|uniref:Protein transport protein SEC61 subunit alpha n=1 Tax=Wickerhamiella sorbophila TaxID=45607 RepID=A0A2T0FJE7_9ASCO|nr:Protein transport protein SEC61 subunit alpha [Wickerhamiella sorbophila]PRT55118.1 Protein transport protein SEC61 subunit alpha [Wickerhamiella sorbophila]
MAGVRFLDIVKPFAPYLPEVTGPKRKIAFNQKIMWTAVVLMIFLVMSEMPLYGIVSADTSDPLLWLRMMLASNRGTLMELGITPIMTSAMVFQLLSGTGLVQIDTNDKADRELLQASQKMLAIILSFGQATVYVMTGMYGPSASLGWGVCLLLILQLVVASIIVILLDELLQKGYGLGSGISLFVATNVCEQVVWKAFSPNTINSGRGYEFEGAVVEFVYRMSTGRSKWTALVDSFSRTSNPNMSQVVITAIVFLVIVYLQTLKLDLPVRSIKTRGPLGTFPVRLFYTSNTPIMLQNALTSNLFMISQMIFTRFPESLFSRIIGTWDTRPLTGQLYAVGGIAYYMQPPQSFREVVTDPLQLIVYVCYVVATCAVFSKTWVDISGTSPKDVARQFKDQGIAIATVREGSTYRELKKIIPIAAALGGVFIGLIAVVSDLVGTLGSGTGILLAATTIYGYYEAALKEGGFVDF